MKRRIWVPLVTLALCGCVGTFSYGENVKGSGVKASESRAVGAFTGIDVQGSADVHVTTGEPRSVTVEADDNLLPIIETEVRGSSLLVRSKKSFSTRIGVKLHVTTPRLEEVEIAGSGNVVVEKLDAQTFRVSVLGSGDVRATGTAERVEASVKGSGDIDLSGLSARKAEASVYGSGDIKVRANESVSASIYGSGDVEYWGEPAEVARSVHGSGEIRAH